MTSGSGRHADETCSDDKHDAETSSADAGAAAAPADPKCCKETMRVTVHMHDGCDCGSSNSDTSSNSRRPPPSPTPLSPASCEEYAPSFHIVPVHAIPVDASTPAVEPIPQPSTLPPVPAHKVQKKAEKAGHATSACVRAATATATPVPGGVPSVPPHVLWSLPQRPTHEPQRTCFSAEVGGCAAVQRVGLETTEVAAEKGVVVGVAGGRSVQAQQAAPVDTAC